MLDKIIQFSIKNKLAIGIMTLALVVWGVWSASKLPIDALPDVTNNQVQVITKAPTLAAQQEQWQKGEQASESSWSCWSVVLDIADFTLPSSIAPASAQGITLSANTRKAIMKAIIFMRCKSN